MSAIKRPKQQRRAIRLRTGNEIIRAAEPTLSEQIDAVKRQEEVIRSSNKTQDGTIDEVWAEWDARCLKAAVETLNVVRKDYDRTA